MSVAIQLGAGVLEPFVFVIICVSCNSLFATAGGAFDLLHGACDDVSISYPGSSPSL